MQKDLRKLSARYKRCKIDPQGWGSRISSWIMMAKGVSVLIEDSAITVAVIVNYLRRNSENKLLPLLTNNNDTFIASTTCFS